jgi:putative oxidoreductase
VKIAIVIARILLGLIFTAFGVNTFLHFIPMPPPAGDAGVFAGLLFKYGWFVFISILYLIAGILLLINRYVGVALTILGPIIVVILLFHITMNPEGIGLALVVAVLEIFLIYAHWHHFRPIYNGHNNNHLNNHSI